MPFDTNPSADSKRQPHAFKYFYVFHRWNIRSISAARQSPIVFRGALERIERSRYPSYLQDMAARGTC
jgi:hypothetical protein